MPILNSRKNLATLYSRDGYGTSRLLVGTKRPSRAHGRFSDQRRTSHNVMQSVAPADAGPVSYCTLRWDGNTLPFTINGAGKLDNFKIEAMADYTSIGITYWDRDTNGNALRWLRHQSISIYTSAQSQLYRQSYTIISATEAPDDGSDAEVVP